MPAIDWNVVDSALGSKGAPGPSGTPSGIDWNVVQKALNTPALNKPVRPSVPAQVAPSSDATKSNGTTLKIGPFDTGVKLNDTAFQALAGAGKFFHDTGVGLNQLSSHLFGSPGQASQWDQVANSDAKRDAPLMNTTAGKVGNYGAAAVVGSALGSLGGGVPAARAASAATQAARIGAVQGLLTPTETNGSGTYAGNKALQTGAQTALGAGTAKLFGAIGSAVRGVTNPQLQTLTSEGVTPTIGQFAGGSLKTAEDKLMSWPFIGPAITSARQRAVQQFNQAALNRTVAPIGDTISTIGRDGVDEASQKLGQAYDNVLSKMSFKPDAQFSQGLSNLQTLASQMPPDQAAHFNNVIRNNVISQMTPQGTMSGETVNAVQSELGRQAKGLMGDPSYFNRQLGSALQEAKNLIDDTLARANPDQAAQFQAVRYGYANYARVRDAAQRMGTDAGVFSPAQLQSAVRSGDDSVGNGDFARGRALMQDFSDAGVSVLGKNYPDSGTAGRALFGAIPSAITTAAVKPETIPYMAGGGLLGMFGTLPYSQTGSRVVAGLLGSNATRQAAAGLLDPLSPYIGAGTANLLAPQFQGLLQGDMGP